MADLLGQLKIAWAKRAASSGCAVLLERWSVDEPALLQFDRIDAVVAAARGTTPLGEQERLGVQCALLRLARRDDDAKLAILAALGPGLAVVARANTRHLGREDADAAVVAHALERIGRCTTDGSVRPGAWIVLGVRNAMRRSRLRDHVSQTAINTSSGRVEIEPDVDRTVSPSDELLALVEEAFQARIMSARGRRLILLYRIYGVPTRLTAAAESRRAGTVRQYRNRAEAALANYAAS